MHNVPHDPDPHPDEQLIEAINAGDPDAFAALYHRHRDWAVNLAFRFTRDREAALDVMQETFLYVLKKFPGFALTAKFTTFLYPVVRHLAIAHSEKTRRQRPIEAAPEAAAPSAEPDPRGELAAVLSGLSEDHRETLLLRFVDGLNLEEIGVAMAVPLGTVKSRLHHALKILREDPRTREYFER